VADGSDSCKVQNKKRLLEKILPISAFCFWCFRVIMDEDGGGFIVRLFKDSLTEEQLIKLGLTKRQNYKY